MSSTRRTVLGVTGAILAAMTAALVVAALVLGFMVAERDADGFVSGPTSALSSAGYAITIENMDLRSIPEQFVPDSLLGTVRFEASSGGEAPIFVGVGPADEVAAYLDAVERSEVSHFGGWRTRYTEHDGTATPSPASTQRFWIESSEGPGRQQLDWQPRSGNWTLVVMNADASASVSVSATAGVHSPWILVAFIVLAAASVVMAVSATAALVLAIRRRPAPPATPIAAEPEDRDSVTRHEHTSRG